LKDIFDIGGKYLLKTKYNSSRLNLLSTVFPEYDWLPWKFDACPNNYWDNMNNQRKFMEWAGKQLNFKDMSDWYNVTQQVNLKICDLLIFQNFCDIGGYGLLNGLYDGSHHKLLSTVYPDYEWLPWKFARCPSNFWADTKNKRKFLEWAGKQLGVKTFDDWYKVSTTVLSRQNMN
jgi:hypothetical protein